jgi:hypothetical protein
MVRQVRRLFGCRGLSVAQSKWRLAMNPVRLRAESVGPDQQYLDADWDDDGNLVLSGQDLGPRTRGVSPDGEYEYWITVEAAHLTKLLVLLGEPEGSDVIRVLAEGWTGNRSHELERIILHDGVPHRFFSYS